MQIDEVKSPEFDPAQNNRQRRPFCRKCTKPVSVCICSRFKSPPIENSIGVTILQHSLEGRHHLNSVRVASLGFKNVSVVPVTDVLFQVEYSIRSLDDYSSSCFNSASNASALSNFVDFSADGRNSDSAISECRKLRSRSEINLLKNGVSSVRNSNSVDKIAGKVSVESNASAFSNFSLIFSDEDDGDDHVMFWSDKDGREISHAISKNRKLASRSETRLLENGVRAVQNLNSVNKISDIESALPMPIEKEESSTAVELNASALPNSSLIWTDEGQSDPEISENRILYSRNEISSSKNAVQDSNSMGNINDGESALQIPFEEEGNSTTVKSELYQITCSSNIVQVSLKRNARPDLSKALSKGLLESLSSKGFYVQRMQTRGKRENEKLGTYEEFHLMIPPGTAILFPGKVAVDLDAVDFDVKHLILLDGTWDKARRMFHENPWLQLLPRIKLAAKGESIYKEVRHQPKPGCLSTIESIICAFKVLSLKNLEGLDELLEVFESMVADQRRLKEEKFSGDFALNTI